MMSGRLAGWTDDELDALSSGLERLVADLRGPAATTTGPSNPMPDRERIS
jgi:hypothetical protein